VFGDGTTSRDYTYVADVVNAILSAISYDASSCEIINIGNSRMVTLRQMIQSLSDALGVVPKYERLPEQDCDVRATCADIGKAQRLLGFVPAADFQEGISRFAKWLFFARSRRI
jgi:UDP-glucuronate 4-epimerase